MKGVRVILVEEWLFFRQYRYHRAKLVLHRASMKGYQDWLMSLGIDVSYIESNEASSDCRLLPERLSAEGVEEVLVAELADDWLRRRLTAACERLGIRVTTGRSPNFLNTMDEAAGFFDAQRRYFQRDFYIWQRKSRGLLMDASGRPEGGKFSYDAENRKKLPRGMIAPVLSLPPENRHLAEARRYVASRFPGCYGEENGPILSGVTFAEADEWLEGFIGKRLERFGDYEDAMSASHPVLFHSVLTPMLNIGLLDPDSILKKAVSAGGSGKIPLNSLEGFVRQLLGWREFIHIVYEREGRIQRTRNQWGFSRKIPSSFWTGETGIVPVDRVIRKVLKYGYCHHIERLMVMGNFMLLCEFDPDEVYRWFMELFIDAYDWVMVPNVYGMTQFADGGLMTTKPYISGSNYLLKMGDFPRGAWEQIWDGLFWRFIEVHRSDFANNQRLGMLLSTLDRMPAEKKMAHRKVAEDYLSRL